MSQTRTILKRLMKAKEHSGAALSHLSGVRAATITRFLTGKISTPTTDTIQKIAKVYGITEAQLRGFEPIESMPFQACAVIVPDLVQLLSAEDYLLFLNMRKITRESRQYVYRLAAYFAKELPAHDFFGGRRKATNPDNPHVRSGESHYAPVVAAKYMPSDKERTLDLFQKRVSSK